MKRKLLLIVIIMNLLLLPLVSHADTITTESKATALNKLTILQGNGIDFNLTRPLKRSEAITFIIRILAKEAYVKTNTPFYQKTTFKDVKEKDWFAPYVGYSVEQGIVNGYPDGGYHPEDSVSEKEFLKLILSALGYKVDVDFVWETIYESAYNLGIVKDIKYKTQTDDNTHYTRADVVDAIYGVLTIALKGSKKTVFDTLLDAKIVDQATAVQLGFAKDIVLANVQTVTTANDVTLSVKMSKSVLTLADKDVIIYETDNKANVLKASVTSQVYEDLIINTAKQIPDKKYTIEISNLVEGSKAPAIASSTFVGHKVLEVKSDYFKISKVITISKNRINVYFTQPITSEIAYPIYFDILKNDTPFVDGSRVTMDVKVLADQNNAVALYLKDATIIDDAAYSVKVSADTISSYGVLLNDGLGDAMAFTSNNLENDDLKIDQMYALDTKTIRMEFNKELNLLTAKQAANFQITSPAGAVVVSSVTVPADGKNKALILNLSSILDKNQNYVTTINNVSDIFSLYTLSQETFGFTGKPTTELKDLAVVLAATVDKLTLQVYTDKKVDLTSGNLNAYYLVSGVTDPSFLAIPAKVYVNPLDPTQIKLYFLPGKELISSSKYKLKILKQVADEQGHTSTADAISDIFVGSNISYVKPLIQEATVIGKDTVKIKTSQPISLTGANVSISNYSLELREGKNTVIVKTPSSVAAVDDTTLIIHFDDLDVTKGYTLKFNTLTDYSGQNIRGIADGTTSILLKKGDTP